VWAPAAEVFFCRRGSPSSLSSATRGGRLMMKTNASLCWWCFLLRVGRPADPPEMMENVGKLAAGSSKWCFLSENRYFADTGEAQLIPGREKEGSTMTSAG
jgi:hypothetical protein